MSPRGGLADDRPDPLRSTNRGSAQQAEHQPRLELRNVTKTFGDVIANDSVSVQMRASEVHALLGENGAGKTTLMRVACGLHQPDAGHIYVDGHEARMRSPKDAARLGISMVHQHFTLVPPMSVVENVVLGQRPARSLLDLEEPAAKLEELSERYGLKVDPWSKVEELSIGAQQRVEILKLLYRNSQIIILDEPTSLLAPPETRHLFNVIGQWRDEGRCIVFISHKLKEVFALADRITVLRKGRVESTVLVEEADRSSVTKMMVGRSVESAQLSGGRAAQAGTAHPVLICQGLSALDDQGKRALDGIDLSLHPGEIVGVAGVEGNGQRELAEVIGGLRKPASGHIKAFGLPLDDLGPADVAQLGISLIPEDRRGAGLILDLGIVENLFLRPMDRTLVTKSGLLRPRKMRSLSRELLADFDVVASDLDAPVKHLSGGNQQKVVLARELYRDPRILIAAQPTQGLDLVATEYVHQKIFDQREKGSAILFISTDLDEILKMSDRIAVIYEGRILDVLPGDADRERIGLLMGGIQDASGPVSPVGR